MAGQRKKNVSKLTKFRRRVGWRVGMAVVTLIALGVGMTHFNSRILHVRYANVRLEDLPESFDGTKILFASDFDLCGLNTADDMDRLFRKLQSLNPDLLLLGGDYAAPSLMDRLNGKTGAGENRARRAFFEVISDFHAPMGKLAISGDNDGDSTSLNMAMMNSGVELIDDRLLIISNGADAIGVAGIGEHTGNLSSLAGQIDENRCVIALMHRPSRMIDVQIAEAGNGGQWADLALAGHTHGGQLMIAGRSLLSLNATEKRCIGGWYSEGSPLLVTQGVGCEGINLRLGSQAEVWLITLRAK